MALGVLLVVLLSCSVHAQREFFINSATGVDTPTCGDESTPCLTINHADSLAINESGDAIFRLSGRFEHFNGTLIENSGGWNRLIGNPDDPESVVIDGGETSERLILSMFSIHNQSGPYYFDGIYFTGFTFEVLSYSGQHVDVRNCIFDFTDQFGALAIEVRTLSEFINHPIPEETYPSNTSTLYAENIIVYNGYNVEGTSIFCRKCYNATVINAEFYYSHAAGRDSAIVFEAAQAVHVENMKLLDTYSCRTPGIYLDGASNVYMKNIEVSNVFPNEEACALDVGGSFYIESSSGLVEIDGLYMSNINIGGRGSGIFMEESHEHVIIRNALFENIIATDSGIIHIDSSSQAVEATIEFHNVTIRNSMATFSGGGIEFHAGGAATTHVIMEDVHFMNTSTTDTEGVGGAITVRGDGFNITWTRGSIEDCNAEFGGGIFMTQSLNTEFMLTDVIFRNLTASDGGAMYLGGSQFYCYNCTFENNIAEESGGCIYMPKGVGVTTEFHVVDSLFTGCIATTYGGAMYCDGGHLFLNDSTIVESSAGLGGGLYVGHSHTDVHSTKIEGNQVGGEGFCPGVLGYGGGVYFADDSCLVASFEDVLIRDNLADISGGGFFTEYSLCGDEWCTDCELDGNEALSFGDTFSAPFARFRPEAEDRLELSVAEAFFVDVIPVDAFDQDMTGDHEFIPTSVASPDNPELFLCGDLSATATQGLARFAFTVYVADVEETTVSDLVNSNEGVDFSLYLADDEVPVELQFHLSGCSAGYELDFIAESEVEDVVRQCMGAQFSSDMEIPSLMQCQLVAHLSQSQLNAVLSIISVAAVCVLALLIGSVYYRKNRVVWSSNLFMLYIAVLGCIILVIGAFIRAFRPTSSAMCMSWQWLFILGLNLPLGSVLAKNMKVWKIFTLKTLQLVVVQNWKLLFFISLALIPDILTLTIQTTMYPLTCDPLVRNSVCSSDTEDVFMALYVVWKCLWLVGGLVVAYLVHPVPAKFNEWKSIVALVSITTFCIIVVWAIGGVLPPQQRTIAEVITTALVAAAFMALIFVPKFFLIFKKRDGTLLSSTEATATKTNDFSMKSNDVALEDDQSAKFNFKERFDAFNKELARTKKLFERSFENTQQLQEQFRNIESNLIALQFERDYRSEIQGETSQSKSAATVVPVDEPVPA